MKIKSLKISNLFGLYNHSIDFPITSEESIEASVIMLYGKNGIGKTTILKMINGLMQLNFTIFRKIKFKTCELTFSNDKSIKVEAGLTAESNELTCLNVTYGNLKVKLNPKETGPLNKSDAERQSSIVKQYTIDLQEFSFEFIDIERLFTHNKQREEIIQERGIIKRKIISKKDLSESDHLAQKVRDFIINSQVYYSRYFAKSEPELFEKILLNLEKNEIIEAPIIKKKINSLCKIEEKYQLKRLGLSTENIDKKKFYSILNSKIKSEDKNKNQKLTVFNSYIEVLESQVNEKKDLAERLLIFENYMNDFLLDKEIKVDDETGFIITLKNGDSIKESQLSSGEYHLLYLTVLALCTKVKGTVVAIDEPEMSMHIIWQRNLVNALINIASKATPQFIFATHSPDIAANFENFLITESS